MSEINPELAEETRAAPVSRPERGGGEPFAAVRPRHSASVVMLLPLYVWTILLVLLPMIYVLVLSFLTRSETYGVQYVFTLSNYVRLAEPANLNILGASLRMAVLTTLITLVIGYPFAYFMARRPKKQRNLLLLLVIVPFWTSSLMRTYGWMLFLRSNGILNNILMGLRLEGGPTKFLYNNGAVLFGMAYSFLPFMILPLYASIEKLDKSIREAARDLGANRYQAFMTVTVPLTMPGVVSGSMLVFVPSVGLFFISDLMGGSAHMVLGDLISYYLQGGKDWPLGAVLSMVMVVLTFFTTSVYRKFASDGGGLGVFG